MLRKEVVASSFAALPSLVSVIETKPAMLLVRTSDIVVEEHYASDLRAQTYFQCCTSGNGVEGKASQRAGASGSRPRRW